MKISGSKVLDAREHLTIHVTKTDVRLGAKKDATSCAAANAICRQHGAVEARVHASRAYVKKGKTWFRYAVPPSMRNEIIAFDRGGEFAPGEYTLSPVSPTVRLDAPIKKRYAENGSSPQRGRRVKRAYHVVSGVREKMNCDWE